MRRYMFSVELIGQAAQVVDFAGLEAIIEKCPTGCWPKASLEGVEGGYEIAIYNRIHDKARNHVTYPRTLLGLARVIGLNENFPN